MDQSHIMAEVHFDSQDPLPGEFEYVLQCQGFFNDPFCVPMPDSDNFVTHWTFRKAVVSNRLKSEVAHLRSTMTSIIEAARQRKLNCYIEIELIYPGKSIRCGRDDLPAAGRRLEDSLEGYRFQPTGIFGGAGADIHVEFTAELIDEATKREFLAHHFYPVTGIDPRDGVPYVVFTLQTQTWGQGQMIFDTLCHSIALLPGFRELTLEQKLGMESVGDCQMPEVIRVVQRDPDC